MKWVKVAIGAVIAIAVMPMIVVTTNNMINLQSEIPVTFEILNDNNNFSDITLGTYESLIENKKITNYRISSEFPLLKNREIEISKYFINEELKNEMYTDIDGHIRIRENVGKDENGNLYELAVKNPERYVIKDSDVYAKVDRAETVTISVKKPLDFIGYNNLSSFYDSVIFDGYPLLKGGDITLASNIGKFSTHTHALYFYFAFPLGTTLEQAKTALVGKTLTYELSQPRLAETYDLTSFQLEFHDHSLSILFDLNDEYQRWRIYDGDVLQMLDGEQIVGNKWTVTFEVYEVQSPILRSLIALVPIIFIVGVISYFFVAFKEIE